MGRIVNHRIRFAGHHRVLAWLVALAVLWAPVQMRAAYAQGSVEQARGHYLKGKELYAAGDFRGAIFQFEEANRLSPSPVLHFNIGLAHEQLGDREKALEHYKAYLQAVPGAPNRDAVQAKIEQLQRALGAARAAEEASAAEAARAAEEARKAEAAREAGEAGVVGSLSLEPEEAVVGDGDAPGPRLKPTGDPELDRALAIDVAAIRDARRGASGVAAAGVAEKPADLPASHQSFAEPDAPKSKPAYKQWWFWAVVGVSAVLLVNIVSNDTSSAAVPTRAEPGAAANPVLLRF